MLVYKATSQTTGKVYIGITINTLEYQKSQHERAAIEGKTYHFYNAIRKYGFSDFIFEVIEDNIDNLDTLNQRERYWIAYYNSYEDGYNSTRGGDGGSTRDDELILKLFIEGHTVQEICSITGYARSTIYRAFKALDISSLNNERKNEATRLRCSRPVLQYDCEGNFIKEWPSATSVSEGGYSQTMVSNVCRQTQLTAHGFLWKYKDDERPILEWIQLNNNRKSAGKPAKPVYQLDLNKNIIAEYPSAAAAARAMGLNDKSQLCGAARKGIKCHGYYWQYKT